MNNSKIKDCDIVTVLREEQTDVPSVYIKTYNDGHNVVTFQYLDGGYLLYQCHVTSDAFISKTYKLHAFEARNGVLLASKNSPIVVDAYNLFLQGAYREFDYKPSVLYVGDESVFDLHVDRYIEALKELGKAILKPDFKPRVIETTDGKVEG